LPEAAYRARLTQLEPAAVAARYESVFADAIARSAAKKSAALATAALAEHTTNS
jgi:hypothetical protein